MSELRAKYGAEAEELRGRVAELTVEAARLEELRREAAEEREAAEGERRARAKEAAAREAALQVAERAGSGQAAAPGIDVLLCTNPTGYACGTRETAQGVDINWSWTRTDVPEIESLRGFLSGRRYRFILDFHEDWETKDFYLCEHRFDVAAAGPLMNTAVEPICAINHETENW